MIILSKTIYRFNAIHIKIPMAFFTELEQQILKFVWKHKRLWIAKRVLRNKSWRCHDPCFQTILQSYSHQNSMVLAQKQTHKSMEQNRNPRNKPTLIWSVDLRQRRQEYTMGKDSLFNKWCWENWTATCKRIKLYYSFTPYTKINSRWIKDLNSELETIKLLEEIMGSNFFDISLSNFFWIFLFKQETQKQK